MEGKLRLEGMSQKLKYNTDVNDFRDFIDDRHRAQKTMLPTIKKAKKILKTIAVRSAEAERVFSLLNSICTP